MSFKSRLKKIEDLAGKKNVDFAPLVVTFYKDDNQEEILKRLKAKYGEDYSPRITVISSLTREEARKRDDFCYEEIEDL